MSNFGFLKEWPEIQEQACKAEGMMRSDPRGSCFYTRHTVERAVNWMYRFDPALSKPYDDTLGTLIHEPSFKNALPAGLFYKLKAIQKVGNSAVHSEARISQQESLQVVKELHHFLYWFYRTYSKEKPIQNQLFDPDKLPQLALVEATAAEMNRRAVLKLSEELAARDKEAVKKQAELERQNAELTDELARLRVQISEAKAANEKVGDSHDYNEAETRKFLIDQQLREVGWDLKAPNVIEFEVTGMPNNQGLGYVDYVLWGEDGKPLAVVEAKRTMHDATKGRQQAKLYADCLQGMYGRRPLIYYTNGYDIFFWDDSYYPERQVQGFYNRDEMQRLINRRTERGNIANAKINTTIVNRYYQEAAIRHICELFQKEKQRKALLVMATGTGKTRTIIALVDLLMRNNWVKNVLFLADRNALVTQAKKEFARLLPDISPTILSSGAEGVNNRVVLSTYQTMINVLNEPPDTRLFTVGHFDLVIVDEAHRSIYKKYRYIFEYFDSLLVGLTATPKDEIDKNTYDIFGLETGVPTYAYEYATAVDDEFLVPAKGVSVPLKFVRQGVKYKELSEEEREDWEEKPELAGREEVLPSELNRFLYNSDTIDKMLMHLMEHGIKVEGGDRLGKTIIFAANNDHANFIYKRFNDNYPKYKGQFARVITYKEDYAETLIDEFKDNSPWKGPDQPRCTIALSVDMLDTGIDVPEIVNLVFFKVVQSKVKFLQMMGRGTRLSPDLFGPGMDKKEFKVFDFCQNFEYFEENPEGASDSSQKTLSQLIFEKRVILATQLYRTEDREEAGMRDYFLDLLHHQVAGINLDNFIVRPRRRYVESYLKREVWDGLGENQVSELFAHISNLPTEADAINEDEVDEELAKRFDHLILQLQLEYLNTRVLPESLREKIVLLAEKLEAKSTIPAVKRQLDLIQEVQTQHFWINVTLPMIENVRRKLRNLIQFVDKGDKIIIYTNFEDELGEHTEVGLGAITGVGASLAQYRKKIEAYIKSHESQPTIEKLKNNEPITQQDLEALEELLFQASEIDSREKYDELFDKGKPLGLFVRELVGLDRAAAKEAFAEYLNESRFNARQIEFVNRIIDYLTANGIMELSALHEPPFTDMHDRSLDGLFAEIQRIMLVDRIKKINANAVPYLASYEYDLPMAAEGLGKYGIEMRH